MKNVLASFFVVSASVLFTFASSVPAQPPGKDPIGHWELTSDAKDCSAFGNHGKASGVKFSQEGAEFDGRVSHIEIPHSESLNIGSADFTIAWRLYTSESLDDVTGDLITKYDPDTRRGFSISLKHHAGATGSQSNYRNLHFGIDQAHEDSEWTDEGRPGKAIFVHSMVVHNGDLYAGTVEGRTNLDQGHVYRRVGRGQWEDLGAPWKSNGVTALASFRGQLYAGVSRVLLHYSGLEPTIAHHIGGKVFRYENGEWVDLGQLHGVDGVNGIAEFKRHLFVTGFYQPALFQLQQNSDSQRLAESDHSDKWLSLGSPGGMRPEALCVFNGAMYATGYDEGAVYRFDGQGWSRTGILGDATQVYGLVVYNGKLHAGTWPSGTVYRYEGDNNWVSTGRLGTAEEVMSLNVYNGKLYAGTLPMAEVFRYDGDHRWTSVGRVDFTQDVVYRRAWSMAVFQGRLFSGTLPSGHVRSFEAGKNVSDDHEFPSGWHHVAAIRSGRRLYLYLDGKELARSEEFDPNQFDLTTSAPLRIGSGVHDSLNGKLRDVRLYGRALTSAEVAQLSR